MDLGYGNEKASKFATNVGLITTDGPVGPNIMAAEWTYYVSYSPALISVHVDGGPDGKATAENITASKEFGVSIASQDQLVLARVAGKMTGREFDKIAIAKGMGFEFYPAKKIKAPMVKGAATNAECRLLEAKQVGDHIMFIGEVLEIESDKSKSPLCYNFGRYHAFGPELPRPDQAVLDQMEKLKEKHARK